MRSTLGAVAAHLTLQFWNCSHERSKKAANIARLPELLTRHRASRGRRASFRFSIVKLHALYQVVKAEAGPGTEVGELTCQVCGEPFTPRDGMFVLKYFLLRRASRPRAQPEALTGAADSSQHPKQPELLQEAAINNGYGLKVYGDRMARVFVEERDRRGSRGQPTSSKTTRTMSFRPSRPSTKQSNGRRRPGTRRMSLASGT
jgi:hypothetical protein